MPSYLVTGVSRGLGWAMLENLSADPNNTVVGIVRNKAATDKRVAEELKGRTNIAIFEAELTKYDALKSAVDQISAHLGGKLDYVIANAAINTKYELFNDISNLGDGASQPEVEDYFHQVMDTNVLSVYHLYSLVTPLLLKGEGKKAVTISSGHASLDLVNAMNWKVNSFYAASKAAVNIITAKFAAAYKKDGLLFYSQCPGSSDTGGLSNLTPAQEASFGETFQGFAAAIPQMEGMTAEMVPKVMNPPPEAVRIILDIFHKASIEDGFSGSFRSHLAPRFRIAV